MPRWDMGPGRPRLHPRPELATPRAIGAQIMGVGTWAEPRSLTTCRVIGPVHSRCVRGGGWREFCHGKSGYKTAREVRGVYQKS